MASLCLPYFGGPSNSSHTMLLVCLFLYSNPVWFAESRQNFLPNIKLGNFLISSALSSTITCYSPMQTSTLMALQTSKSWLVTCTSSSKPRKPFCKTSHCPQFGLGVGIFPRLGQSDSFLQEFFFFFNWKRENCEAPLGDRKLNCRNSRENWKNRERELTEKE